MANYVGVVDGGAITVPAEDIFDPVVDAGPARWRLERWPGVGCVEEVGNVES